MTSRNLRRLEKLSQLFVAYIAMIIRRCVTTKHVGAEPGLDRQIAALAIRRAYGLEIEAAPNEFTFHAAVGSLSAKIPNSAEDRIRSEVAAFLLFKVARLQQLLGQPIEYEPTAAQMVAKRIRLRVKLATERRYFADVNAAKANITYENIIRLIALLSPALLLGGLLEQLLLSKQFGYDMSLVFSLGDYVSASLSPLVYSIVPVILVAIVGYWTFHERSRLPPDQRKPSSKADDFGFALGVVMTIAGNVWLYLTDRKNFFTALPFGIMLVCIFVLPPVIKRYFRGGLALFVFSFFLVTFFGNTYSNTMKRAFEIRNGSTRYIYTFKGPAILPSQDRFALIVSGSNFTVFYDQAQGRSVLVRSDEVLTAQEASAP